MRRRFYPEFDSMESKDLCSLAPTGIVIGVNPPMPPSLPVTPIPWESLLHGYQHTPKVPMDAPPTIPFCPIPPSEAGTDT